MKNILTRYDIDTGEKKEVTLPDEAGFIDNAPVYYGEDDVACIEGDAAFVIDIGTGKAEKIERIFKSDSMSF